MNGGFPWSFFFLSIIKLAFIYEKIIFSNVKIFLRRKKLK